ncbi:hypothetical protein JHFBIEKO_3122 [Methylobacterium mesophilicum]|nr:hypothetical protein JHFBIEKO_3122 [Methylobacterium mesophilicum]
MGSGRTRFMREAGVSKTVVWRWQDRFAREGVDGLLPEKTRPARILPLRPEVAARVVALTQGEPPGETTHWTAAAMSKAVSISVSSVQRIWRGHGLQPHRVQQFKLSTDPTFAAKLRDVAGLYVDPPAHAVILSVDEKSKIQALARTQDPLPMKPGPPTTRTHDYKRDDTTTIVCRSGRSGGQGDRPVHAAPPAAGVHPLVETRSRRRSPLERSSTRSWTTMPSTSTRRSAPGSTATRAGPSTSPPPPPPGSMPSRASLPKLQTDGCDRVCLALSSRFRPPSNASSPRATATQNSSSGPQTRIASSKPPNACIKR